MVSGLTAARGSGVISRTMWEMSWCLPAASIWQEVSPAGRMRRIFLAGIPFRIGGGQAEEILPRKAGKGHGQNGPMRRI